VQICPQPTRMSFRGMVVFVASVLALSLLPASAAGIVGLVVGVMSLVLLNRQCLPALKDFDWASIVFLIGIFIVVAAVEQVGLLKDVADWISGTGISSTVLVLTIITWVSVALSSFIDNVPYTVLMIPACAYIAQAMGVSPWPFYFGMLVGTGIGGNITPVARLPTSWPAACWKKRACVIRLGSL